MRKTKHIILILILYYLYCVYPIAQDQVLMNEENVKTIRRFETLQKNLYKLVLFQEYMVVNGGMQYPIPDWLLYNDNDNRNKHYYDFYQTFTNKDMNQKAQKEILENQFSYHFDILRLFPYNDNNFTTESIKSLLEGNIYNDPFAPDQLLGYISTPSDYCYISIGPDMKTDVLGFNQFSDGSYYIDGIKIIPGKMGEIEKRGFRLYKDYQKPYSLWDQRDWNSQIRIPCYMIYDPTNGIFSCGDIIFHRREERENYLFTYPGFEVLKKNNFQMKDIKYLFISK